MSLKRHGIFPPQDGGPTLGEVADRCREIFYRKKLVRHDEWTTEMLYEQVSADTVIYVSIGSFTIPHKGDDHCNIGKYTSVFREKDGSREYLLGLDDHASTREEFAEAYLKASSILARNLQDDLSSNFGKYISVSMYMYSWDVKQCADGSYVATEHLDGTRDGAKFHQHEATGAHIDAPSLEVMHERLEAIKVTYHLKNHKLPYGVLERWTS